MRKKPKQNTLKIQIDMLRKFLTRNKQKHETEILLKVQNTNWNDTQLILK